MSRLFDNASSEFLQANVADFTVPPISISAWAHPDDAANTGTIYFCGDNGSTKDWYSLRLMGGTAGDPLQMRVRDVTAFSDAETSNSYNVNAWNHVFGKVLSATSRTAILNGDIANEGNSTASRSPTTPNRTAIGRLGDGTPSSYFSGRIAEVAVWDVGLSDDEVVALSKGISPLLIRPGNLISYRPILGRRSPEVDLIGGNNLTATGTVVAEHAPVSGIRRPFIGVATTAASAPDEDAGLFVGGQQQPVIEPINVVPY